MSNDMLGVALRDARGPLKDLLEKLSGEDGVNWLRAFNKFLRREDPWLFNQPKIAIWCILKFRHFHAIADLLIALNRAGCREFGELAYAFEKSGERQYGRAVTVHLVRISVAQLGFLVGASYSAICDRARQFGLELCPLIVAPQLRLHYLDQPLGETLIVATMPLKDDGGRLFGVYCDEMGNNLRLTQGGIGHFISTTEFVFMLKANPENFGSFSAKSIHDSPVSMLLPERTT